MWETIETVQSLFLLLGESVLRAEVSNAELSNTAAADDWPTHAVSVGQEGEREKKKMKKKIN